MATTNLCGIPIFDVFQDFRQQFLIVHRVELLLNLLKEISKSHGNLHFFLVYDQKLDHLRVRQRYLSFRLLRGYQPLETPNQKLEVWRFLFGWSHERAVISVFDDVRGIRVSSCVAYVVLCALDRRLMLQSRFHPRILRPHRVSETLVCFLVILISSLREPTAKNDAVRVGTIPCRIQ